MQKDFEARRWQVEEYLGRALTADELVAVSSLSELSPKQRAVLDVLARRHRLAAWLYVERVVVDVTSREAMPLIDRTHDRSDISSSTILVLRPQFELDPQRVEGALHLMPGSFAHPTKVDRWILPARGSMADGVRKTIVERPRAREPTSVTLIRRCASTTSIVVFPGSTTLDTARARKFVETLLEMGPFELEVGRRLRCVVTEPLDIYGYAPWEDPDASPDPA